MLYYIMLYYYMFTGFFDDLLNRVKLNRGFPLQFQKHFMIQPREAVFIQLFSRV